MSFVKLLSVLAVCGAVAAKRVLDWAEGKRPSRTSTDSSDGGTSDWGHGGHHGGWGDHDGGDTDGSSH